MKNLTDEPVFQKFHIEGIKHISPLDAYELATTNQAVIIDVRNEDEIPYESIALDNVLYHPMDKIVDRLNFISKDQNIILVCPVGVRSVKVTNLLKTQGFPNVANLDGGFDKWIELKLPFKAGIKPKTSGCCCGDTNGSNAGCCDTSDTNNKCC